MYNWVTERGHWHAFGFIGYIHETERADIFKTLVLMYVSRVQISSIIIWAHISFGKSRQG
jgi:hypothetical protein